MKKYAGSFFVTFAIGYGNFSVTGGQKAGDGL